MGRVVGLTGGVASGKSLVSEELKKLGALVVDADEIARDVLKTGGEAFDAVVTEFGKGILTPEGGIDRKKLGSIVFSDPKKLKRLNELTHPLIIGIIRERIVELRRDRPEALVVLDAPLLIEVGLHFEMDAVIVVYAERELQIKRTMAREGLSKEEAQKRISAQLPLEDKKKLADHVIDNSGTKEATVEVVRRLYDELMEK